MKIKLKSQKDRFNRPFDNKIVTKNANIIFIKYILFSFS